MIPAARQPQLILLSTGQRQRFAYDGTPGPGTLVASHAPDGPGVDPFGNEYPGGDSCAAGYALVPMIEVWPGVMLWHTGTAAEPDGPMPCAGEASGGAGQ